MPDTGIFYQIDTGSQYQGEACYSSSIREAEESKNRPVFLMKLSSRSLQQHQHDWNRWLWPGLGIALTLIAMIESVPSPLAVDDTAPSPKPAEQQLVNDVAHTTSGTVVIWQQPSK